MELSLEELTIEIVVEGYQKETSSHSNKAAKQNAQLQQLVSLFSEKNKSELSRVCTEGTVLNTPSSVSDEALCGEENGAYLSKEENSGTDDSKKKIIPNDGDQNLAGNSRENLQVLENQSSTKIISKESELDVFPVSMEDMVQDIPSKVSEGTSLENKYEKHPCKGKDLSISDSKEKTVHGDGNKNRMESSEENTTQTTEKLLGSKIFSQDSESELSHVPVENKVQEVDFKEFDIASLDKKDGECPLFKEVNLEIAKTKGEKNHDDQNLMENSRQNIQSRENQASVKNLNNTSSDETKLKDSSLDAFHRLPSEPYHSHLNIKKSKCLENTVQRNTQQALRSDTESALQLDTKSVKSKEHAPSAEISSNFFSKEANSKGNEEHALTVEVGLSNSFGKGAEFIQQLESSNVKKSVSTVSEDASSSSGGTERIPNMTQCFDKHLVVADHHSVGVEDCELNKEKLVSESNECPSFSLDSQDAVEKATYKSVDSCELREETGHHSFNPNILGATGKAGLETIKRQCINRNDSAFKTLSMAEFKSLWFVKGCNKSTSESETTVTEKSYLDKPMINTLDESCDLQVESFTLSPGVSQEASPLHFINTPKYETVRNWLGHEDIVSVEENELNIKEKNIKDNDLSNPYRDIRSKISSSMYFQSIAEDMDFDADFFQCPIPEDPSMGFSEHSKSSLFFGETASNDFSPSHVEVSEEPLPDFKSCSESNSISMSLPQVSNCFYDSKPSTSCTQVPVPLSCSVAQPTATSTAANISLQTVSSILRKEMPRQKVLIISKNSQAPYMAAAMRGMNSNLSLMSPDLLSPFQSLRTEHMEMGFGGKGVGCRKLDIASKLKNIPSNEGTEMIPESTAAKPSCVDEGTAISCSADAVEGKLICSQDFTGLPSESLGREQDNHHSAVCVEPDKSCRNSGALLHSPTLVIQDKESKLSKNPKTEWESKLSPTNLANMLSNNVTSKQASLCYCSGVGDDYKICECITGNLEHTKKNIIVHHGEQISHKTDIFCDSDADADKLPTISNSDNKIHITVARKAIDHCSTRAEKESVTPDENCVTEGYSGNYHINHSYKDDENTEGKLNEKCLADIKLLNDVHVYGCHTNEIVETKFNEIKDHNESHILPLGSALKRKADDQDETFKKQKLQDSFTDIPGPLQSAHCGALMCGILDNSVHHNECCCSSLHNDFQDFDAQGLRKERQLLALKTYTGSRKRSCASECNVNDGSVSRSNVAKELAVGNEYLVCSNTKETANITVQDTSVYSHNFEFGSLKANPQYDGNSYSRMQNDVNDLNFLQIVSSYTGFLAPLISPAERLSAAPEPQQDESDSKHCVPQESDTYQEGREKESRDAAETAKHKQSPLHENVKQNISGPASAADNYGLIAKKNCVLPHTGSQISSTNDILRTVNTLSVSCKDDGVPNRPLGSNSILIKKTGQTNVCNATHRTSADASGSQKLKRIIIFKKPSQVSPSVSQDSHVFKKTCSTAPVVLYSSSSASASATISSCGLSNAPAKVITCESHTANQCVAGVTGPQSCLMLPKAMSSKNTASHSQAMDPLSFASSKSPIIKFVSTGIKKQDHQIDYQKPVSPNTYTVVPPALVSCDAALPRIECQASLSMSMSGRSSPESVASSSASLNSTKHDTELTAQNEKNSETQEEAANMLKIVKMGSKGSFYLRPTPALKNAILEMRKNITVNSKIEDSDSGCMILPDGAPIPPPAPVPSPVFIPNRNEVQAVRNRRKRVKKKKRRKKIIIKDLVEEKVKELLESCNEDVPKMIVVYARKSFHICQIDVTEKR